MATATQTPPRSNKSKTTLRLFSNYALGPELNPKFLRNQGLEHWRLLHRGETAGMMQAGAESCITRLKILLDNSHRVKNHRKRVRRRKFLCIIPEPLSASCCLAVCAPARHFFWLSPPSNRRQRTFATEFFWISIQHASKAIPC